MGEPPKLGDRDFHKLGIKRSDDRRAFMQRMGELRLRPGPTYTFSFWCISQFLDALKWSITGIMPGMSIDFDKFCGSPPVHLVLYTLDRKSMRDDDERHLESRKNYLLRTAFWSSKRPPQVSKIAKYFPDIDSIQPESSKHNITKFESSRTMRPGILKTRMCNKGAGAKKSDHVWPVVRTVACICSPLRCLM